MEHFDALAKERDQLLIENHYLKKQMNLSNTNTKDRDATQIKFQSLEIGAKE